MEIRTWIVVYIIKGENMKITPVLRKRFCKDMNIPINIYQEPYFTERLKLFDENFRTLWKWERFKKELEQFKDDQEYLEKYNQIKEAAINFIKESKSYQRFISTDLYFKNPNVNYPNDIYKDYNVGEHFVSIDMKQANFNALRIFEERFCSDCKSMFNGAKTWKEFISQFTDIEHIIESKYIRQVIFGALNPKRQVAYEKQLMLEYLEKVKDDIEKYKLEIAALTNDEIVLKGTEVWMTVFSEEQSKRYPDMFKYTVFRLFKEEHGLGWFKNISFPYGGGYPEYKCVDVANYPFILRDQFDQSVQWYDKVFYHEGRLAMLLEEPKIKWLSENDWIR